MKKFTDSKYRQQGFTLVEMIIVMVITGIIGGMVAIFIRAPVQGYLDSGRRAEMTDVADTAVRRISRDLHLALPNSVRVSPDGFFLEFIPTTGGGRYRSAPETAGPFVCVSYAGAVLDFGTPDNCFEVIGPMPPVAANDQVVVYNLGIPGADAYAGNNRGIVSAVGARSISFNPAPVFPLDACQFDVATGTVKRCRFQVVTTPVTYACVPVAGGAGGTLTRYWGYAIQDVQTKTDSIAELNALVTPVNATRGRAILANNVSGCGFTYNQVAQRSGVVTMALTITQQGESVSLFNATQVSNVP